MMKDKRSTYHTTIMKKQRHTRMDGIPDGYISISSEDGQQYLVPHFMIPATNQAFKAYQKKLEFDVYNADGGVSQSIRTPTCHPHSGLMPRSSRPMPFSSGPMPLLVANAKPNCSPEICQMHHTS